VVFRVKPDVLLVNGPGSCVPLCLAATLYNIIGITNTRIIFIESFTRVQKLSLTGRLLYPLAHRVVVQWPQLALKHPRAEYLGPIC
jgi:beta-1,4-N-acetylglucosaminyltransferase